MIEPVRHLLVEGREEVPVAVQGGHDRAVAHDDLEDDEPEAPEGDDS